MTTINFKIEQDQKDCLAKLAEESDQTPSQYMRSLVRHAIAKKYRTQMIITIKEGGENQNQGS